MLKAVIFDLDNTLYDYDINNEKAMNVVQNYIKSEFNIEEKKFLELYAEARKETHKILNYNFASRHNRAIYFKRFLEKIEQKPYEYVNLLDDLYWNTILDNMKLNSGVIELFELLKNNNIKIAISSNLLLSIQLKKIKKLGIGQYIDYILTSEEIGTEKPSKLNFLNVLKYLKLKPNEVIFIGDDFNSDIVGAQNVGILGILINKNINEKCLCFKNFNDIFDYLKIHYIEHYKKP